MSQGFYYVLASHRLTRRVVKAAMRLSLKL